MNNNLEQINLLDLIPSSIAGDPVIRAACQALNQDIRDIATETKKMILFKRLDELEEPFLTHLAYHLKVEFWDNELTDQEKRNLIRSSIAWHKIKGTAAAVEKICGIIFGSGEVTEWYEYGGESYRFRIRTTGHMKDENDYDRLIGLVQIAKNERSVLDGICIVCEIEHDLRIATALRISTNMTIAPYVEDSVVEDMDLYFGTAIGISIKGTITISE